MAWFGLIYVKPLIYNANKKACIGNTSYCVLSIQAFKWIESLIRNQFQRLKVH